MRSIGFDLDADVVFPEGRLKYGYWFAACHYQMEHISALTEASTAPIMAPSESLKESDDPAEWSYFIDINGRQSIVRPPSLGSISCMVSMTTSFGSMTITGGDLKRPDPIKDCDRIVDLMGQIEPWIND